MINHFCALSDYNFLAKGMALYESLLKDSKNFVLHYLCLDDKSYKALLPFESSTLKVYTDSFNDTLARLKNSDKQYYSYTMSSYFSHYLMLTKGVDITYVDSDIVFHQDSQELLDKIGDKDVGMFRHRHHDLARPTENGWFNVGVLHFKNSHLGNHLLSWWSDAVLYRKFPHLATCGDQRYLDAFLTETTVQQIFIDGDIGHGAPWHWQLYDYSNYFKDGTIMWNGNKQKLMFSHFSDFDYNLGDNSYKPAVRHSILTPQSMYTSIKELKFIHDQYFEAIKDSHQKYNID